MQGKSHLHAPSERDVHSLNEHIRTNDPRKGSPFLHPTRLAGGGKPAVPSHVDGFGRCGRAAQVAISRTEAQGEIGRDSIASEDGVS